VSESIQHEKNIYVHPNVERISEYMGVPVAIQLDRPVVLVTHGDLPSVPASNGNRLCPPFPQTFEDTIVATDIISPVVIQPDHTGSGVKVMYEVKDDSGTPTGIGELRISADMIVAVSVLWDTRKSAVAQPAAPKILLK
jgi:hypothetical protein